MSPSKPPPPPSPRRRLSCPRLRLRHQHHYLHYTHNTHYLAFSMTSQMEWSHDFCLSCDRQMEGGTYCSQACRLADLEKAGQQQPALSSSASSTSSSNNGFYLPPAVNFSQYKGPSTSRGFDMGPSNAYHYYSAANGSYVAPPTAGQRSLTPSSSRSSLSSNSSTTQSGITAQAASQLNNYVRSFDQTREQKRRYNQY